MKILDIANNNIFPTDLEHFSPLLNLEELHIGSWEKNEENIYNRFHGSLEPLKNLINLRKLNIDNTDIIDSNLLDHLPKNLAEIHCDSRRENAKCSKIEEELKFCSIAGKKYGYNFQDWREIKERVSSNNPEEIKGIISLMLKNSKKLIEEKEKLIKIKEEIREIDQNKSWSNRIRIFGSGLTLTGSAVSGASDKIGYPKSKIGNAFNFFSSLVGGSLSLVSSARDAYATEQEVEKKEIQKEMERKLEDVKTWNKSNQEFENLKKFDWSVWESFEELNKALYDLLKEEDGCKLPKSMDLNRSLASEKDNLVKTSKEIWKEKNIEQKLIKLLEKTSQRKTAENVQQLNNTMEKEENFQQQLETWIEVNTNWFFN